MPLNRPLRRFKKFKRFKGDEGGVSEVVGTILTLAITVVLFTSVFAVVTQMDEPEERDHADFEANFERIEDAAYINITHRGGASLEIGNLEFILSIEGETYRLDDDMLNSDDTWSSGQVVVIFIDEDDDVPVDEPDIELMIRKRDTHQIIYTTTLVDREDEPITIRWVDIKYKYEWREYTEPGDEVEIRAEVVVGGEFDVDDVTVEASVPRADVFDEDEPVTLEKGRGNVYSSKVNISSDADIDRYSLKVTAEVDGHSEEEYLTLNVGEETVDLYRPDLVVGDIRFSPGSPSHGDEVVVTADIYNNGRVNYTAEWEVKDDGDLKRRSNTTFPHGPAPTRIQASFVVEGHGPHDITVSVSTDLYEDEDLDEEGQPEEDATPIEDVEPEDNRRTVKVHVDPHVLVVRDSLEEGLREGRIMENALISLNLDFERMDVNSGNDVPDLDEMYEHSLIIWMSGNRTEEIHVEDASDDLDEFIENGGAFWLIGSNLDGMGDIGDLEDKLGSIGFDEVPDDGFSEETVFEPGGEDGTYGDLNYTVRPGDEYLIIDDKNDVEDNNTLIEEGTDDIYGVGYDVGERNRTAVNSFLFENIMDAGQRSTMVSNVVSWITNMETRSGVDVAVSSQLIEPANPMFMDEVVITATLRNNGPEDLYVTVRCERNGGEEILRPEEGDNIYLPKDGGTETVTFIWIAEELGVQEFIAIADYYNEIDMVTRRNNDIRYKDLEVTDDRIEVNVHYSTLLVDADYSIDGDHHNATRDVEESFIRLGHKEGIDYDYVLVEEGEDGPGFDQGEPKLEDYNAVFWVTGERKRWEDDNVLTEADMENLESYVNQERGANLILMGEYILEDLDHNDEDEFLEDVLGIDPGSIGELGYEPEALIGQEDNRISRGLKYELYGSNDLYTFYTEEGTDTLFQDENGNDLASMRDDGRSKVIYMGINLSHLSGPLVDEEKYEDWPAGEVDLSHESAREEFIYTTMWQLGKRDDRAELRVLDHDIEFSTDEPHTGRSYEIRAEIQNIGYRGTSALIRVKEGEDYVGAESAFIEGSRRDSVDGSTYFEVDPGTATIEVTWRPSYAGNRDIRVRVDPVRRTREISEDRESEENKLMEFHNQATVTQPVYYFHDDMETGDNWDHDTTVANIDGSGALDLVENPRETQVHGDWDGDYSGMTARHGAEDQGYWETDDEDVSDFTDKASYSSPRSYWMPETYAGGTGERKPIDMVLVVDTSGSMVGGSDGYTDPPTIDWWEHAYDATRAVAHELREGDRLAIFDFESGSPYGPRMIIGFNEFDDNGYCLSEDNQQEFIEKVISPYIGDSKEYESMTPLYDTVSRAIQHLDEEARPESEATRAGILMTDGGGNYDVGSELYEPGTGHYEVDTPGPATYFVSGEESGLLGIPYDFMTVTLGHLTRDSRLHAISASATGENNFGVFEEEPKKLGPLFAMYTAAMVEESEGGIRSERRTGLNNEYESIVTDFSVFSDAFLGGMSGVDLDEWETVYGDQWNADGFDLHEINGDYRSARANDNGDSLTYEVDPSLTLDNLQGEINSIEDVIVNFEFSTPTPGNGCLLSGDSHRPLQDHAELDVYVDGDLVEDGFSQTSDYDIDDPDTWDEVYITDHITNLEAPFEIEFRKSGADDEPLDIVSVNVLYRLDYEIYTGPSPDHVEDYEDVSNENDLNTSNDLSDYEDSGIEYLTPPPYYRYTTTPAIEVPDTTNQKLSFRTKYWMTQGTNGGIMYLWGRNETQGQDWVWQSYDRRYIRPDQSYTGNLDFSVVNADADTGGPDLDNNGGTGLRDAEGDLPYWCFNGKSVGGTFEWTYISVDLSRYEEFMEKHDEVRVVFVTAQMGGISEERWRPEMGWYLDNVRVTVTRDAGDEVPDDDLGYWMRVNRSMVLDRFDENKIDEQYYHDSSGDPEGKFWMYAANDDGEPVLPKGVDSSLYTSMITLSNAENPELSAYMRFNFDDGGGRPPNGLRVEISEDDGRSWETLTYGIRVGWNHTGHSCDYSGETDDGEDGYGWVDTSTLVRLNTDLSDWRGKNVRLRFRVFTNETESSFYHKETLPKPVFIDNVIVRERDMDLHTPLFESPDVGPMGLCNTASEIEHLQRGDQIEYYEIYSKEASHLSFLPGIERTSTYFNDMEKEPLRDSIERRELQW